MNNTETTPTAPAKPKLATDIFESEPCSRCWGSGTYSYCQAYGTRCFKCAGRSVQLTKHGQKNYSAWRAAVDAITLKSVADLTVGCSAKLDGMTKYYEVAAISEVHPGRVGHGDGNGGTIWLPAVTVTFTRPVPVTTVFGVHKQTEFEVTLPSEASKGSEVRIHPGNDLMPQAEAFVTAPPVKRTRKPKESAA
jgi:hypothetical protein